MSNNNDAESPEIKSTPNSEASAESIFKQVSHSFKQANISARKARMEAMGIASLAIKTSRQYFNEAKEAGKLSLETNTKESAEAAPISPVPPPNAEQPGQTNSRFEALTKSAQQLSVGLAKKVAEDQKVLRERLTERLSKIDSGNAPAAEDAQSNLEGPVKTTSWQSRYTLLLARRDNLLEWASESAQQLLADAEQEGKDIDIETRKRIKAQQQEIALAYQKLIGKLGFAAKSDLNELNRKLFELAQLLEKQNSKKPGELINLERRRVERRQQQQPVEFDKRIYERRS